MDGDTNDGGSGRVSAALATAANAQVGALGEETARFYLEQQLDAVVVTLGDAGMPRTGARQDLDITAILDGTLIVFEVKTRYLSARAGKLTRTGNLPRPRLGRTSTGSRQGSQSYAADRLADIIDTGDGYAGIDVQVIVVDFRLMLLQFFTVDDGGRLVAPVGPPAPCAEAAVAALDEILNHRGYL
ncbi:hypothetical protein [Leifsonia aquatica]|uniref:hypothetical protein n=1 Tax=Leifsonia aquatica TaxID=144185 RepID=UPI003816EB2C